MGVAPQSVSYTTNSLVTILRASTECYCMLLFTKYWNVLTERLSSHISLPKQIYFLKYSLSYSCLLVINNLRLKADLIINKNPVLASPKTKCRQFEDHSLWSTKIIAALVNVSQNTQTCCADRMQSILTH